MGWALGMHQSADGGPWLTLGCLAMLDLIFLFLVTLVVVFNTLATVSMLLKAVYADELFPTPYVYSAQVITRGDQSRAKISCFYLAERLETH